MDFCAGDDTALARSAPGMAAFKYPALNSARDSARAAAGGASDWTRAELSYTTRRRRLSSITRAPCRKVMGMPGQRWAGGAVGNECNLVVFDTGNMLHDAFPVRGPRIDAE
jgi:hypothetical protein